MSISDIKDDIYGKFIEDNEDDTYTVDDGTRHVAMKVEDDNVLFLNSYTRYPYEWTKALPIISIKNSRHEQLYFENRTQIINIDGIFKSPNYFKVAKSRTVEIIYMTPIEYMELCVIGFGNTTLEEELRILNKERVKQYANDMLKGDLFPLVMMEHYKDGFEQEGRHRVMAVQYLIDNNKIPKDTEIPVVIVTEV